jgi:hypothetical protein
LSIPRRRALRRYGEEADTRRACPPPPLPAFRPSRDFDVLELRRDCHAYVLSSFQRTGRDPERPRPRMLVAPHPAGSLPANPTCRPFLGEPFNLTKTNHALSSAFWVSTACRFATSTHRVASRDGVRKRWLVVLSVCPTWEPGTGPAWGRTPKAKLNTTRRGLACQPSWSTAFPRSLLESYLRSLRRPLPWRAFRASAASHTAGQRARDIHRIPIIGKGVKRRVGHGCSVQGFLHGGSLTAITGVVHELRTATIQRRRRRRAAAARPARPEPSSTIEPGSGTGADADST